ncbi:MAG: hypothetical protein C0619_15480 [Desulfuromonas sp.]|nr:MAG: hypothetical protein C0619_15480 [Desulfuromonas sp.]
MCKGFILLRQMKRRNKEALAKTGTSLGQEVPRLYRGTLKRKAPLMGQQSFNAPFDWGIRTKPLSQGEGVMWK